MEKIHLGKIECSPIAQGFWRLMDWKLSAKELAEMMAQCIDMGVTTMDTAEVYGGTQCESLMGDAFAHDPSLRRRVQLVTKTGIIRGEKGACYDTRYYSVISACHRSLDRLKTDYIDIYLIHREDPYMDPWETGAALLELKKQGLVREIGVSNFDPFKFSALNTAVNGQLVTNQIELNPLCFEHFLSGMIDSLMEKRISPMIWSPLAGGAIFNPETEEAKRAAALLNELSEKYEQSVSTIVYAWLLRHPVKALAISGSGKLSRLEEAVKATDVKLSHEDWYRIYTASGRMRLR